MVRADINACAQIIDNLISNAIKYSPLNKHIYLNVEQKDEFGCVQIRDQGPGLSKADQQHLFEKFTRLSSMPTAGEHSSGLGLSIVKKLSNAMNGDVYCESEAGDGCLFGLNLQLSKDPAL